MKNKWARCIALLLTCALCVGLVGCDQSAEESASNVSCSQIAYAIRDSQTDLPELSEVSSSSETWSDWLHSVYDIDPQQVADGCVLYGEGSNSDEIAVIKANSAQDVSGMEDKLSEYVQRRRNTFSGYAPDEEYQLSNAQIVTRAEYIALLAVPDVSSAKNAFSAVFSGQPAASESITTQSPAIEEPIVEEIVTAEPVQSDAAQKALPVETPQSIPQATTVTQQIDESVQPADMSASTQAPVADEYDHDVVLTAWQAQDPSSLSGQNLATYEKAAQILGEVIAPGMSLYDQELAVHNYLTQHISYDPKALERHVTADADPTSSTPYGGLVLGTAICYGYSSSFQLLMDMLGIPCITINGTINEANDAHSWNMVSLDGSWYMVDVGWDDPTSGEPYLVFFNRASDDAIMRQYNRQWDENLYPEAEGGPYEGPM